VGKYCSPAPTHRLYCSMRTSTRVEDRWKEFQSHCAAHIATDAKDSLVFLVELDDDVAMRANASAEVSVPLGDGVIFGPPCETKQIARFDRHLSDIKCYVGNLRFILIACCNGLVNVRMVGDRAPKLTFVAQATLAHDPGYECGGPWIPPSGGNSIVPLPDCVLSTQYPSAIRCNRPIPGDRVRHTR